MRRSHEGVRRRVRNHRQQTTSVDILRALSKPLFNINSFRIHMLFFGKVTPPPSARGLKGAFNARPLIPFGPPENTLGPIWLSCHVAKKEGRRKSEGKFNGADIGGADPDGDEPLAHAHRPPLKTKGGETEGELFARQSARRPIDDDFLRLCAN